MTVSFPCRHNSILIASRRTIVEEEVLLRKLPKNRFIEAGTPGPLRYQIRNTLRGLTGDCFRHERIQLKVSGESQTHC